MILRNGRGERVDMGPARARGSGVSGQSVATVPTSGEPPACPICGTTGLMSNNNRSCIKMVGPYLGPDAPGFKPDFRKFGNVNGGFATTDTEWRKSWDKIVKEALA